MSEVEKFLSFTTYTWVDAFWGCKKRIYSNDLFAFCAKQDKEKNKIIRDKQLN